MEIIVYQIISLVLSVLTIQYIIKWVLKKPKKGLWAVPVLSFLTFNIILIFIVWFGNLENKTINQWSSARNLIATISYSIYWIAKYYGAFNGIRDNVIRNLFE